jgi:hypothetical protein
MSNKIQNLRFTDFNIVMNEMKQDESLIFINNECVVMRWDNHFYEVPLDRIKNWAELTDWILHLCSKGWINPYRLRLFGEIVIKTKKWKRLDA